MSLLSGAPQYRFFLAALLGVFLPAGVRAEQAVLPDGQEIVGRLQWKEGRLWFASSRPVASRRLDQVAQVRFPAARVAPCRAARVYRVTLRDGQRLTGKILGLEAETLRFRLTWGPPLTIPRTDLASLTQRPGLLTFFDDDFEEGLKSWKVTGGATRSDSQHVSGKYSLRLQTPGQSAEHVLPTPLSAGQVGINFRDGLDTAGSRWLVDLEFQGSAGPRVVRAVVAGDGDSYRLEVPGAELKPFPVRRIPGWHRLQVEFGPKTLLAFVDDDLLWVSRLHGPGGPLRKVRLACVAGGNGAKHRGEVFFDDLSLARAVEPLRHQPADPGQDGLWLASGDQLLGTVSRADARTVALAARFGTRAWNWGELRGVFFRQQAELPRSAEGEFVTVWLRTGAGPELDRITGLVRGLDEHHLSLRHPVLGTLDIDRERLRRLEWVFHGRRLELDSMPHHLGPKGRLVAGLQPPRAEGVSQRWSFRLDAVPAEAALRVRVVRLKGPEDGIAAELGRGELRAEVVVNGTIVDYLNRHVRRSSREPRRLTVALPPRVLRAGTNTLEIRLTPERATGHYEGCGVAGLVLEMPR